MVERPYGISSNHHNQTGLVSDNSRFSISSDLDRFWLPLDVVQLAPCDLTQILGASLSMTDGIHKLKFWSVKGPGCDSITCNESSDAPRLDIAQIVWIRSKRRGVSMTAEEHRGGCGESNNGSIRVSHVGLVSAM